MKKITMLIAFLCSISAFSATTYLVDNGSGTVWTTLTGPGGTVTHVNLSSPAQTLTAWLTATTFASGDQVWITKGTYNVTSAYTIPNSNLTAIYGGFAGTETNTTRIKGTNAWDYTNETVIDGGSAAINLFTEAADRTITIDGLTVTHFGGINPVSYRGGTIVQYCKFTNNTVTGPIINYYTSTASMNASLISCYFYNNAIASGATTVNAACIYSNNGSSGGIFTVSGCTFESNVNAYSTTSGASACVKVQGAGTNNISSCIFKNNTSTAGNSSAVSLVSTTSNLINCLVYGAPSGSKSALYISSGNVYNCTFVNNLGGGAYVSNTTAANVKLTNTVFWGTDGSASSGSGYISTSSSTAATITNCAYNNIQTAQTPLPVGTVSLTTSSIPFNNYSGGDYSLSGNSTLIGAGSDLSSSGISGITSDIAGNSRGTSYAIGAYQWASSSVVVTNAGFEDAASGYTVSESSLNVLRRVAGIADGTTQIASPTSSAISVTPGMWLKKAPSTNYISGVISNYDPHSGTNCLNLKIKNGTPNTGYDTWTNAIALQKLSFTNTQKYTVSFWAKIDPTASNVASVVTAFIRDNVTGTNLSCAIPLTGGTTWTQYSATFDIPTFKAANVTADFTTAFAGIGLTTTYDASTIKTNYSGVLLDDFSVTTTAASTVAVNTSAVGTGCVVTGGGVYTVGSSANVVASPNNGYKFVNWTEGGTEVTTTASYTFTVSAARTLVANFVSTNTTCTVSPTTLSGFSYTNGNGPSSEQSFTVSGTNLLSNIAISSSTNCQISTGTGASFVSTNPILLTNSGTLATTTIYIRLKAGLAAGTIASENTTISTLSLAVQNVASSGSVSSNPVLTFATPTSVSKTYGNAVFTNAASSTAGSAGAVTYASGNTAVATVDVNSGQVSIVGAGSSVITASIAANGIYGAANASYTLNVAQKSLTITATGPLKTYGTALTAGTSATNFTTNGAEVSGETISIVTLTPDAAGLSATTAAGVAYIVSPSLATGTGGFSASNYNITYTAYNGTVATTAPNAPTIGTATAGNGHAWVSFSAPSNNGGANITSYTVTSSPDGITGIGSTSPILVTGLSNKAYSFTVTATNSTGTSAASAATNSATPNTGIVNVTSSTSVGPLALTSGSDVVVGSGALLTIDATTSVNSLTIAPGGQVTNSSSLTASAMTINSDGTNSGTGTYIDNDGTTTAVTTTTVNQTLTSARNWYISSPISVAKAQTGYTFYSRDETNNAWTTMTTGNGTSTGDALNIGQGYIANLASGTATYSFSGGTLNTGTITTGLNGVPALTLTSTKAYAGYNLVGNPYPSYLDWVAVSAAATNVDASFWYRTKNGSVYEFDTYNASSGVGTNNATVITRYIPPMQAFWVKVSSGTSGTLALTNAMRSHNDVSSNKFRTKAVNNANQSVLYLQVSNGVNSDEAIVLFNSNASNGLDAYDSQKMSNANSAIPEIYTTVANESLVINGMNAIPYDTEIPLGFTTGQAGTNFCIKASQLSNFPSGTKLILKDYHDSNNPIIADLSDGSSYIFSSGVSTNNTSRFALIFKAPSITTGINPADSGSFWFSTNANGQIMLNGTPNAETSVAVYNAIGQRVAAQNLSSTIKVFDTRLVPGVYTIVLKSVGKTAKTKVIIK